MMLRRFLKDSFVYGTANIFAKGVVFLLIPIYTRAFSPRDFGIVDYLATFALMMSVIIPLGISNGIARYFPDAKTDTEKTGYASTAFWFTLFVYVLFTIVAILFQDALTSLLLDSLEWKRVYLFSIIAIAANGVLYFFQNLLRWQLQARKFIVSSLLSIILTALVTVFCVVTLKTGIIGIFYGQVAGAVTGGVVAWRYSRNYVKPTFNKDKLKVMLLFSLPMVPALLGEFFSMYIDRIAIKKMMTMSDVGLYGIGFRFASVVNLLMTGFSTALTPLIFSHYREEATPREISRIFSYFIALVIPLLIAISFFSREVLWIFTTPRYYSAWTVIPILSAASLLFVMYNFAPGLGIAMRTKTIALIHITAALLNAVLNYFLIQVLGIMGAALSTLVSAVYCFLCYMVLSQKLYPVPHAWKNIILAVTAGVACAVTSAIVLQSNSFSISLLAVKLLVFIVIVPPISWLVLGSNEVRSIASKIFPQLISKPSGTTGRI